jgi:hypothetical protein
MRQVPSFSIQKTEAGNYTVSIQAIEMKGKTDSVSSNTDASLRLTGISASLLYDSNETGEIDNFTCTILTKYPDAWVSYLNETAGNAGLEYDKDYELDKMGSDGVYLSFHPTDGKNLERLYISKSVVQAELGPGGGLNIGKVSNSESDEDEDESIMKLGKWYCFDTVTGTYDGAPISTSPTLLKDYDSSFVFPSGSYKGLELTSYSSTNNFSQEVAKNKKLVLNFNFKNFAEFNNTPSSATIRMIYMYKRNDSNRPDMDMWFTGKTHDSINPQDNWRLYNDTFMVSPGTPSDLNFNVDIDAENKEQGTLYIDYLAVYLS